MLLELISLCKCNFSSFHNYLFLQVQVGVLPELIFKQVVMQVPFWSIPGFWGTLLGLRHCREDSVGIFALENQSHWVGSIWVEQHRSTGIPKQRRIPGSSTQRNNWENVLKWAWTLGVFGWGGFGVYFFGTGKKGHRLWGKSLPEPVPQNKKTQGVPTLIPSVLAHSRIVFWTLGLKDPRKCP